MKDTYDVVVVGGGAAGFFTAIQTKIKRPDLSVIILEKSSKCLAKVQVSGGRRCNVTHACFDPSELIQYYPRGNKELRSVFHQFQPADMIAWLEENGVATKIEDDGRVFPVSNSSLSIINLFMQLVMDLKIEVATQATLEDIQPIEGAFDLVVNGRPIHSKNVVLCNGGGPGAFSTAKSLGHSIVHPVPSLFTFKINHPVIKELMGVSVPHAAVQIRGSKWEDEGPLLITHWGLSGPAVLKLSSWAARELADKQYQFEVIVNWAPNWAEAEFLDTIAATVKEHGKKKVSSVNPFELPNRLWNAILAHVEVAEKTWANLSKADTVGLMNNIIQATYQVNGKTTFKEEFVTCGGVDLKEINFKSMESKLVPNLYFAGEVLNIDALTGGFNFQAAWSEAYIAAQAIAEKN